MYMNGKYVVTAVIACGIAIFPFFASARSFSVHTSNATNVTATSAVLEAYATGFDGDATISFDWGQDNLDTTTARETTSVIGEKIRIRVSGLSPSTHYTFRARGTASNSDDDGITLSFTTQGAQSHASEIDITTNSTHSSTSDVPVQFPRVITQSPTAIYGNSATLRGYADAYSNNDTRYWFQYGIRGGELAPSRASMFTNQNQTLTSDVWRLSPNTEYEYRAVAENALGISVGEIVRFRTVSASAWRAEPTSYQEIAVANGTLNISDPEHPTISAMVWTAGSPVRVKVEYGSTRAVTQETDFVYVAQTGNVIILLPALTQGRTYYYRLYAEDGHEYIRGDVMTAQIPKDTVAGATTNRRTTSGGQANASGSSFWQRFVASLSGKKTTAPGIVRDVAREEVLVLSMRTLSNGSETVGTAIVPKKNDILTFSFILTDTVQESVGVFRFVVPAGCTYLSSDGVAYNRANRVIDGKYTFQKEVPVHVRCIVDDIQSTKQVLGTFSVDNMSVTSNEVSVGKSGFSVGALALGAFSLGTSTLVIIFVTTFLLAIGIVRLHDKTLGKKEV